MLRHRYIFLGCLFLLVVVKLFHLANLPLLSDAGKQDRRAGHHVSRVEIAMPSRLKSVSERCGKNIEGTPSSQLMERLIVNDHLRTIFCPVPGVSSKLWKRAVWLLSGGVGPHPGRDNRHLVVAQEPDPSSRDQALTTLDAFDADDRKFRLDNYFVFMFVRDPYERLLAGYENKYLKDKRTGQNSLDTGSQYQLLLFNSFLKEVTGKLSGGEGLTAHYDAISDLCEPCAVRYNFIGKAETFYQDTEYILENIWKSNYTVRHIFGPVVNQIDPRHSLKLDERHLNASFVSASQIALGNVREMYKQDFLLFDYEPYRKFAPV